MSECESRVAKVPVDECLRVVCDETVADVCEQQGLCQAAVLESIGKIARASVQRTTERPFAPDTQGSMMKDFFDQRTRDLKLVVENLSGVSHG